tara:strand:- start:35 stop:955 length:921 start_codon:yes stop_codon:yes gene_type:complete
MTLFKKKYEIFHFFSVLFLVPFLFNIQIAEANFISKFFKQRLQEMLAPKSQLWEMWKKRNPNNKQKISHKLWEEVLSKNLFMDSSSGINLFNYRGISKEDRKKLNLYIKNLGAIQISSYRWIEQKAYWINLYNALTVQLVINHYPLKTIKDIELTRNHAKFGPWDAKLLKIENVMVSLNDIEHRILRPLSNDPRIHYALNCASLGCPSLNKVPFNYLNMEELLEKSSYDFVNHSRGLSFKEGGLYVSSIYVWFRSDFEKKGFEGDKGVINHLKKYARGPLKKSLDNYQKDIKGHFYDWKLNGFETK